MAYTTYFCTGCSATLNYLESSDASVSSEAPRVVVDVQVSALVRIISDGTEYCLSVQYRVSRISQHHKVISLFYARIKYDRHWDSPLGYPLWCMWMAKHRPPVPAADLGSIAAVNQRYLLKRKTITNPTTQLEKASSKQHIQQFYTNQYQSAAIVYKHSIRTCAYNNNSVIQPIYIMVKMEYQPTHLVQDESLVYAVDEKTNNSKCADILKHNPGIDFCEKCAPVIPGVYRPQALMSTTHSRRAHHELSRQMQNKIAAQNIRDRRKAYAIYLTQGIETLTLDNEARRRRINEARAKQTKLQQEYDLLRRELEQRHTEQIFTDAVMMFELSDVDTDRTDSSVDTCVESSDSEGCASPSTTEINSPLLCQYTVDDVTASPLSTTTYSDMFLSPRSGIDTYDTLSICSPNSPFGESAMSPSNLSPYPEASGLENTELQALSSVNFDLSPYNQMSLCAR